MENKTLHTKIYGDRAINIGTLIGGPIAAGYLIAENYKVFNEFSKARRTWLYTILASIIIFRYCIFYPGFYESANRIAPGRLYRDSFLFS